MGKVHINKRGCKPDDSGEADKVLGDVVRQLTDKVTTQELTERFFPKFAAEEKRKKQEKKCPGDYIVKDIIGNLD